jgi:hypothetical protein
MACVNEVETLVIEAQQDIIAHTGSYDSWDDRITKAIIQCSQPGTESYWNDLLLKVRYQLKNVGLEAGGPKVLSLDEIKTHTVPGPGPTKGGIPW